MQTPVMRTTSGLAITSLVTGILGWVLVPVIGALVAIVTGHMARADIRHQPERLDGDGMAVIGLILGYSQFVIGFLAVVGFLLFFGGLSWLASVT